MNKRINGQCTKCYVSSVYSCLLAQTVNTAGIGDFNKNLTNGSSHAHVMDDQQGSETFCWKLDVEYHKYIYYTCSIK